MLHLWYLFVAFYSSIDIIFFFFFSLSSARRAAFAAYSTGIFL